MSEGGKPGLTAKVKVATAAGAEVVFEFDKVSDVDYFEIGQEYIAHFMPTAEEKKDGE